MNCENTIILGTSPSTVKPSLLFRLCAVVSLWLLISSCSAPRNGLMPTKFSTNDANKTVLVTIDGDVRIPGEHKIPQKCDTETMRQAVGGWFSELDGGPSPPSFFLYRGERGVTNSWKIQFREISVSARTNILFQDGDRIHINRSWL